MFDHATQRHTSFDFTLGSAWIKTHKQNIAAPLDTTTVANVVVQIYLEHEGDLELIAKRNDSADLDFSRYSDTFFFFFEVVFTGGRTQPDTTKPEEGEWYTYAIFNL
eukprot:Gb_26195 [translate_table: standard]